MQRLRVGDLDALGELFELTAPTLFSMACEVLHNSAAADEVITDVYVHVSQSAPQFDISRTSVTTWLLMICRSRVIERYRNDQLALLKTTIGNLDAVRKPYGLELGRGAATSAAEDLNTAVGDQQNSTTYSRRLLNMAFFRGLGRQEISAETKLSIGTVKTHLRRALSALRD